MFVYGLGLTMSILAFLAVGAVVSFVFASPQIGLLPAAVAGIFVFASFFKQGAKMEHDLENPEPIMVSCSPEEAFEEVYKTLLSCHMGRYFWDLQPIQNDYSIRGVLRFGDSICGMNGSPEWIEKVVRINVRFDGGGEHTRIKINFVVNSPRDRFMANNWIRFTVKQIKETFPAFEKASMPTVSLGSENLKMAEAFVAAPSAGMGTTSAAAAERSAAERPLLGTVSNKPRKAYKVPKR